MSQDILAERDYLFLGSRMKRLAERLQADATRIIAEENLGHLQSVHMPIFAALHNDGALTVTQLIDRIGFSQPAITRALSSMSELGFVKMARDAADRRVKIVSLTACGRGMVNQLLISVWPRIEAAAKDLCRDTQGHLLEQLSQMEEELDRKPLPERAPARDDLEILPFSDELAGDFYRINEEWVSSMFTMEANDYDILEHPRERVVDNDGEIWFIKDPELGMIGTVALIKISDGVFELTKMGVSETARGKKAGEKLLAFVLGRASTLGIRQLYLLTNSKCEAAIHLYEKLGFQHDAEILAKYSARYERCNVAMSYPLLPG